MSHDIARVRRAPGRIRSVVRKRCLSPCKGGDRFPHPADLERRLDSQQGSLYPRSRARARAGGEDWQSHENNGRALILATQIARKALVKKRQVEGFAETMALVLRELGDPLSR